MNDEKKGSDWKSVYEKLMELQEKPSDFEHAADTIAATFEWVRDKLSKLHDNVADRYTRRNLVNIGKALDIQANPKLRAALNGERYEAPQSTDEVE